MGIDLDGSWFEWGLIGWKLNGLELIWMGIKRN